MDGLNGYLAEYVDACFKLARTMRIKFTEAALLMNEKVVAQYGVAAVDVNRPETWKWYMNVSGQYHPTDVQMTVVSIDTLQPIVFSKEMLDIHTATRRAYEKGTRHYETLVLRYPDQKLLIDGILYPADIDRAIEAQTGEIIAYQKDLVLDQELTLIQDIGDYLKRVTARWLNAQFAMSNDLYCATFYGQLYAFLVPEIMSQRLKRCKTDEVHDFHVRMYLSSHSGLEKYIPYLTRKQALWLYRNILYIERNAGKTAEFDTLLEKILTDRAIPVSSYSIRHQEAHREDYRPDLLARKQRLNLSQNSSGVDYLEMDELFNKQRPLVPGNPEHLESFRWKEVQDFELAKSAVTQTRTLDSTMVDYSNAVPETFEEVALRQWCYLANHGLYDVAVTFKEPATGNMRTLMALDAFIYMYYLQLSANGYEVDRIPEYLNMQQRRHPKPSVEDLMSVVPSGRPWLREVAQKLLSRQPTIVPIYSVSGFYDHAKAIYDEALRHWYLISGTDDMYDRGYIDHMVRRLYSDERVEFDAGGNDLWTWLDRNDLPRYNYSREEAFALIKSIYSAATGFQVDHVQTLSNIQKAMIGLFKHLNPYPLQFVREINEDDIIVLDRRAIRHSAPRYHQEVRRTIDRTPIAGHTDIKGLNRVEISLTNRDRMTPLLDPDESASLIDVFPDAELKISPMSTSRHIVDVAAPVFGVSYEGQDRALDEEYGAIGYTLYDRLPDILKARVKSKYDVPV